MNIFKNLETRHIRESVEWAIEKYLIPEMDALIDKHPKTYGIIGDAMKQLAKEAAQNIHKDDSQRTRPTGDLTHESINPQVPA